MVNTKHPDVIWPSARGQPMGKWIFGILVVLAGVTVACGGTSEATRVPDPTAALTPTCPTADEAAYFDELGTITRGIGDRVGLIAEDLARASQNPLLLGDESWITDFTVNSVLISVQADIILELAAPASAVDMGRAARQMAERIKTTTSLYYDGVENANIDKMEAADEFLTLAAHDARRITGLINRFY